MLNIECDRKIIRYSVKTCNHPSQERHTLRNNPIHQIVSSSRTLTRFTQKLHQSLAIIKNESTWILRNNTARSNTDLTTRVGKKKKHHENGSLHLRYWQSELNSFQSRENHVIDRHVCYSRIRSHKERKKKFQRQFLLQWSKIPLRVILMRQRGWK